LVADLLFKRGFILIYSSFLRNNVMIFQILVCEIFECRSLVINGSHGGTVGAWSYGG